MKKVICNNIDKTRDHLTIGKEYIVIDEWWNGSSSTGVYYLIKDDKNVNNYHYYGKFSNIKELRKKKLEKLK
jgi:hypothetical protein